MSLNNRCDIPNLILSHYPIINDDAFESAIKNDAPYALGKLIISHPNIKNVDFSKMLSLNPSKKIINVLENYNIISFN